MPRKKPQAPIEQVSDKAEIALVRGSLTQLRVGGRHYDLITDRNCPICMHPGRAQIEARLTANWHYPDIVEWASDIEYEMFDGEKVYWPTFEAKHLASHFRRNHVTLDAKMAHQFAEARDAAQSEAYEHATGRVVDEVVFAQMTLARVEDLVIEGKLTPTYKEGMAAAKLLADQRKGAQQAETEDRSWFYEQAMEVYFTEARKIMTEEQWSDFSRALTTNAFLNSLVQQAQAPDIQDAEVVEA